MAGRNTVEILLSARDQASGAIRAAFGSVEESHNRAMSVLKIGSGIAAGAFTALGGYIAKVGVDYDTMTEQSQVAWTTLLGSQDKAKKMLVDIATFAKNTPFETEQVDMMAKYMNNAGFAGKALFDQLMRISDVSSAFNIPADSAEELARQMSQVVQAGVAYTEDLNILQDRGVPIYSALAKELHTTTAGVKQMASQGKITSKVYMEAFQSISDTVKGASDKQSQTFGGMISTFQDTVSIISGILAKPIFDKMKEGLNALTTALGGVAQLAAGDFQGFSDTMNKTFGNTAGQIVSSFTGKLIDGFKSIGDFVNKGKQALEAFFDYMKGDAIGGIVILTKMGLSTDQIIKINDAFMKVKDFVTGFVAGAKKAFSDLFGGKDNLSDSFSKNFQTIKDIVMHLLGDVVFFVKNAFTKLKEFWDKDGDSIMKAWKSAVKMVSDAFEAFKPVLKAVFDFITIVGVKVFNSLVDVVILLGGKMNWIIPILGGVTAAITAFKIISSITTLINAWKDASIIATGVQKAMAVAQWALNVALDANPIGLVVIAIGALVAAGITLYQNWDTVSAKMSAVWSQIQQGAAKAVNFVIDQINDLIRVINRIPGVSIPIVPKVDWGSYAPAPGTAPKGYGRAGGPQASYASGTDFHPGGLALVGEEGPEIVDLPRGSGVRTAAETKKLLGGKGNTYNVKVINNQTMDEYQLTRYLQRLEALNG